MPSASDIAAHLRAARREAVALEGSAAYATLARLADQFEAGTEAATALAEAITDAPGYGALRQWRSNTARDKQVPPYVIATDAMLRAVAVAAPETLDDLAAIRGMGAAKVAAYGDAILAVLKVSA